MPLGSTYIGSSSGNSGGIVKLGSRTPRPSHDGPCWMAGDGEHVHPQNDPTITLAITVAESQEAVEQASQAIIAKDLSMRMLQYERDLMAHQVRAANAERDARCTQASDLSATLREQTLMHQQVLLHVQQQHKEAQQQQQQALQQAMAAVAVPVPAPDAQSPLQAQQQAAASPPMRMSRTTSINRTTASRLPPWTGDTSWAGSPPGVVLVPVSSLPEASGSVPLLGSGSSSCIGMLSMALEKEPGLLPPPAAARPAMTSLRGNEPALGSGRPSRTSFAGSPTSMRVSASGAAWSNFGGGGLLSSDALDVFGCGMSLPTAAGPSDASSHQAGLMTRHMSYMERFMGSTEAAQPAAGAQPISAAASTGNSQSTNSLRGGSVTHCPSNRVSPSSYLLAAATPEVSALPGRALAQDSLRCGPAMDQLVRNLEEMSQFQQRYEVLEEECSRLRAQVERARHEALNFEHRCKSLEWIKGGLEQESAMLRERLTLHLGAAHAKSDAGLGVGKGASRQACEDKAGNKDAPNDGSPKPSVDHDEEECRKILTDILGKETLRLLAL